MRVPTRKPGKYANQKLDPNVTMDKFNELKANLEKLKKHVRPRAIEEMSRLAAMGDFSENVGYQMAKGKLRGINDKIDEIENFVAKAKIIDPKQNTEKVQLGHSVTIEIDNKIRTYQILGSAETDPTLGVISQNSPLGSALLNKRVGDIVEVQMPKTTMTCKIIKIE